jgi:flagellar capping protein FliD
MTERETIRQLARQESAKRSESAQQQQGSTGMMNEQHSQLAGQLRQLHERLDHIEKNLILQQPDVLEFTKTAYPYLEAAIRRCEAVEQKLQSLEKMAEDYKAHMADNWETTDGIIENQKNEFTAISQHFQGLATKDLQGILQSIRAELAKVLAAEKKCDEALAECRSLAQQVGQTYETASATIEELAETATKHVNEVKENSAEAIDQARVKFVKTFRRLDTILWDHPILGMALLAFMAIVLSTLTVLTLNTFTSDGEIRQSVEASTTATQEALKPLIEKIEKQTQNLDVIYQQSEAFELYLRTLPAKQRDKKRAELIEGAKMRKVAEDARRRAD